MKEILPLIQVVQVRRALPHDATSPQQSTPPRDPSLPDNGQKIRLNLRVWRRVLHEPIKTRNQQQQRIQKILNFFIKLGILNNLDTTPSVQILKDALTMLERGARISNSAPFDWKAKISQLNERIRNLRKFVVHGVPVFNIWDAISFIYTICTEDITTSLEAQLYLLQFRIIILSLRSVMDYFDEFTSPRTVAATWTDPQPFCIAFATTAVGDYPEKGEIGTARREFIQTITREFKKIPPSANTRASPNQPGNCPEIITIGSVCRAKGTYSTLCLTMSVDPHGEIYKCCTHCEDLRELLSKNGIGIKDLWKESALGCSLPFEDAVYPYCKLKTLEAIIAEFGQFSDK